MTKSDERHTCFLLLEDGTVLPGESFGARNQIDGEVGKQHVVIGYVFGLGNKVIEHWQPITRLLSLPGLSSTRRYNK